MRELIKNRKTMYYRCDVPALGFDRFNNDYNYTITTWPYTT